MSLLRRCRVNAALTIQLFSQLFHFVNMWLFNRLVTDPESGLCSHYWGAIIRQQLGHVEAWAEKQGLELAADCHLSRIVQVGCPGSHLPAVGGLNVVSASPLAGVRTWIRQNGCLMGTGKAAVVRWFARCFSDTRLTVQEAGSPGSGVGRVVLCLRVQQCSPCGHAYLHTSTLYTHTCDLLSSLPSRPFLQGRSCSEVHELKTSYMNCRGHSSARSGW